MLDSVIMQKPDCNTSEEEGYHSLAMLECAPFKIEVHVGTRHLPEL